MIGAGRGGLVDVALIGAGPMGRLHAQTVLAHPGTRLVEVVDRDPARAASLAREFGAFGGSTLRSDAPLVIVATPTHTHAEIAAPLLDGRWVLVEKPLAASVQQGRYLVHPRCLVGHSERHHPALRGRPAPHHAEVLRESPWSGRGIDTDVVFDVMLHDLDLVRQWSGGDVELEDAGGVDERGHGLDTAWAKLVWAGGHARLDASRVASRRWRRAFLDGEVVDLLAPHEGEDALTSQLTAVLQHVRTGSGATTAEDGLHALVLAEQVRARASARGVPGE